MAIQRSPDLSDCSLPNLEDGASAAPLGSAQIRYWILVLGTDGARLYDASQATINLAIERARTADSAEPGWSDTDPDVLQAQQDRERFAFLRRMEGEAGGIIDADPHPLVVVGQCPGLASFVALSRHRARIVGIVHGEHLHTPPDALVLLIRPLVATAFLRQQARAPDGGAEGPPTARHSPPVAEHSWSGRGQCDDE